LHFHISANDAIIAILSTANKPKNDFLKNPKNEFLKKKKLFFENVTICSLSSVIGRGKITAMQE